ncbi:hypothetical protein B0H10DRAFT_2213970 [Mycena sp. CBHHK59/15]|nr:hypothetical protein B0H10DRAFT_2213970 [Mycena sp. CBHHK59/15]
MRTVESDSSRPGRDGREAETRAADLPPGISYKFMHSHVLLAACREEGGTLEVDVGSINGVVVGTQFVVATDAREKDLVRPSSSQTVPVEDIVFPEGTRFMVSDWKNHAVMMKVFARSSEEPLFAKDDVYLERDSPRYLVVDSEANADVTVARDSEEAWYLPASSAMSPPLPAKSGKEPTRITIGYGAGGGYAFQFHVCVDKYLDLKGVEQPAAADAAMMGGGRHKRDAWMQMLGTHGDVAVTMFIGEALG